MTKSSDGCEFISAMANLALLVALLAGVAQGFAPPATRLALVSRSACVSATPRADSAAVRCQEDAPRNERLGLVDRSKDPFGVVRVVLYSCFGVAGVAGCGIALMQGDMGNLVVNAGVTAVGVGIFLFDRSMSKKLSDQNAELVDALGGEEIYAEGADEEGN